MLNPEDFYDNYQSSPAKLFLPWNRGGYPLEFRTALTKALVYSIISPDRLYMLWALLRVAVLGHGGDVVEMGAYRGGSALLICHLLESIGFNWDFHVFDRFERGLPAPTQQDRTLNVGGHQEGQFGSSYDQVRDLLAPYKFVRIYPGDIRTTLGDCKTGFVRFAHLDMDLYQSTVWGLDWLRLRMERGAIILADDYAVPQCLGVRAAIDEFIVKQHKAHVVLPTGQVFIVV